MFPIGPMTSLEKFQNCIHVSRAFLALVSGTVPDTEMIVMNKPDIVLVLVGL